MEAPSPGDRARRLAAEALAADDPTGWFERLYRGDQTVPWHQGGPDPFLVRWAADRNLDGSGNSAGRLTAGEEVRFARSRPAGLTALVIGAGLGDDAEFVAGLGFDTVAFDVAPSAVERARRRFPDSTVRYEVADLLDLPADWRFDLVVENFTVQSLPVGLRERAIAAVAATVAPGGTLIVHATYRDPAVERPGPPWPLTRSDLELFALEPVTVTQIPEPGHPELATWQAEFTRPG
ncbi:class I SAM-dependent methyltransferase [Virgisporangium ochraceum]|uniref:Methyltransferase type 12 n=1 Tax=Virgisporangium ochraceum TaxID=65505 RepID=A0A8J4EBF0_9ACTN|nr:class I SAM-dependent methyltransferase [Virgisporangium ochraceum]GIJ65772.1 methyltransferase type 12 [Virgisporangium ochraceum]